MAAEPIDLGMRRRVMVKTNQDSERVVPFSCSTNLSNDVTEHLSRVKLGGAAASFCLKMHRDSFGQAGNQRDKGLSDPGLWCEFNLAVWSRALSMEKSNIRRIRADLEACHIITYVPDDNNPGSGQLKWNLNFSQWTQYNKRPGRTAANEIARTQRQDSVVILTETPTNEEPTVVILRQKPVKITTPETVKITTVASHDDSDSQGSDDPLRKVTKELLRTTPNGVTHARARASPSAQKVLEVVADDDTRFKIALYFRVKLLEFAPGIVNDVPAATPKGLAKWCEVVRLLLKRYDKLDIGRAIDFVFQDTRWWAGKMGNSMDRFHRDFPKIYTDMHTAQKRGNSNGQYQPISAGSPRANSDDAAAHRAELARKRKQQLAAADADR